MLKIPTDPNRIVYEQQWLNSFNCIVYSGDATTPSDYIEFFKASVDQILESHADQTPTNIKMYISRDDGDITYELYADTIESVANYESRLARLLENESLEEARKIRIAKSELLWDAEAKRRSAQKKRDAQEVLALSTDPELEEYERLKAKFKLYDAVKKG